MDDEALKERVCFLEGKVAYLEEVNRFTSDALSRSALLWDFHVHIEHPQPLKMIFEETSERARALIGFEKLAIYLVDEDNADFYQGYVDPFDSRQDFELEFDDLVENHMLSWALSQNQPTVYQSRVSRKTLLLHPVATVRRTRGILMGFTLGDNQELADSVMALFSLLMVGCANAVESFELYDWIKKINDRLEEKVGSFVRTERELKQNNQQMTKLLQARSAALRQVVKQLSREHNARLRIEGELETIQREITRRAQKSALELETIHERVRAQENFTSVKHLAAGIAHELNNPLNFIAVNFGTLTEYFEDLVEFVSAHRKKAPVPDGPHPGGLNGEVDGSSDRSRLDDIDDIMKDSSSLFDESFRGFERINRIIRDLQAFDQGPTGSDPELVSIGRCIEESLRKALRSVEGVIQCHQSLGTLPDVYCHEGQIRNAFYNLLLNSAQAVESLENPEKGLITLTTWSEAGYVCCRISDNGPGIPEHLHTRVFEPFFTTKPPGSGTGLGLSLAYDAIVNKHNGRLTFVCPKEGGTIFTVRLLIGATVT